MPKFEESYKKLVDTLQEIFMLDQADLDFGIYRIMNQKRDEINDFLENRLLAQVKDTLAKTGSTDSADLKKKLDEMVSTLKEAGVNPDDNPKVQEMQAQYKAGGSPDALANEVFSNLTNFFRRYYDKGDFISKRRYKKDVYAIPYEGEEIKLHWANYDQYYIKTSENFRNYRFKVDGGKKVTFFALREASTEQDNNKTQQGKERRFKLVDEDFITVKGDEMKIWFTYEPSNKKENQKELSRAALKTIADNLPDDFKVGLLRTEGTKANPDRTVLEKHLTDYTARNTFDYFIHKDLGGFLNRELDFYIKNEILHIDDIDLDEPENYERQLRVMKGLKKVARDIIVMLAQLENFQKKLWLKKKFVVKCDYCITLDQIPEDFYEEIVANHAQREEWVKLFAIDEIQADTTTTAYSEPLTVEFLKSNEFLILDTQFFGREWKYKLLNSLDDLDEKSDGLIVNSENFQALRLLSSRFKGQVKCVHIDPPYNTDSSGFLYKNSFRHSSWMSMMVDRIMMATAYMDEDSSFVCHIDENEYERLYAVFNLVGHPYLGTVIWDKKNPMMGGTGIAIQHEYMIWSSNHLGQFQAKSDNVKSILNKATEFIDEFGAVNDRCRSEFGKWVKKHPDFSGGERANHLLENDGRVYQSVGMSWPNPNPAPEQFFVPLVHTETGKECPVPTRGWSRSPKKMKELLDKNEIIFGKDESTQPRRKIYLNLDSTKPIASIIRDGTKGKVEIDKMGLDFSYCHPTTLYETIINGSLNGNEGISLDFFAGSGTTGHAVVNLNREDQGQRIYILVEMGEYFDTVTKPRIQKAGYCKNWKEAKPADRAGTTHFFKYLILEGYEDCLNNLSLERSEEQTKLIAHGDFGNEYMLNYMLDIESRESLLNTEMFKRPFGYAINITENNELVEHEVDLVETFNYLIGLVVEHICINKGNVVVQGKNLSGDKILVIWRDVEQTDNKALNEFFQKLDINTKDSEFKRIYVNGDNNLDNLRTDDEQWKVVLIEEEFHKQMFDLEDV